MCGQLKEIRKFLRTLPVVNLHAYLGNVKGKAAGVYAVRAYLNIISVS